MNSMDAVSDRDFVVEHLAALALVAVHLSRLAEELVYWSSAEFGFIEMDDAYATGSSIMPQKKNSDAAELVRGKSGRAIGTLVQMLVTLKGLPLTYNKDMQEDKEGYFRAVDDVQTCLQLSAEMIATLRVRPEALHPAVSDPLLLATDLADHLARSGLPFREAHGVVGAIVRDHGRAFTRLPASELARYHPLLADGVPTLTPRTSVQARDVLGGTAPRQVTAALRRSRREHTQALARLEKRRSSLQSVEALASLPW
jgi:argininosuccinate lyase